MNQIQQLITHLDLQPHPEGGYFKEVYRSEGIINNDSLGTLFSGTRNYCTSIYYLLTTDTFSAFHKINQDETWHFYDGATLKLHIISPEGNYETILIGKDVTKGEVFQYTVPAGYWFGATVQKEFALCGCTVSPGFDFQDFELAKKEELLQQFPQHKGIIGRLCRV